MEYFSVPRQRPAALTNYSQQVAGLVPDDVAESARRVFIEGLRKMYLTDFLMPEFLIRYPNQPVEMTVEGTAEVIARVWHESSVLEITIPALYASQLLATEWIDFLDRAQLVVATHALLSETMKQLPALVIKRVGISQRETEQFAYTTQHFVRPGQLH